MSASELARQAETLESWSETQKSKLANVEKRVDAYLSRLNSAYEIVRETEAALKELREEISGTFHEYQDKMQSAIGLSLDLRKELARLRALQLDAQEAMSRGETEKAEELTGQVGRQHDALEPTYNSVNSEIRAAGELATSINAAGKRVDRIAGPEIAKKKGRSKRGKLSTPAGPSGGNWSFRKQR